MSNTQMPPSPVDPSTVGPRAHALIACIRQAGIKASEADRAAQTLENIASTSTLDNGIMGIVVAILSSTWSMSGPPPNFSAVEQAEVYDAFKGVRDNFKSPDILKCNITEDRNMQFTQAFRQFVTSVVDKREVMAPNPCKGSDFAGFLLACKVCIDKFASSVTALVPSRVDDAQSQLESFDRSLNDAIDVFRP